MTINSASAVMHFNTELVDEILNLNLNSELIGTSADKLKVKLFNELPRPRKVMEAFFDHCQNQQIESVGFDYIQAVYKLDTSELQGLKTLVKFNIESNFELQEVASEYFMPLQFGNCSKGEEHYNSFLMERYNNTKKREINSFFKTFFESEENKMNFAILLNCEMEDFELFTFYDADIILKIISLLESINPLFKTFDKFKTDFETRCCNEEDDFFLITDEEIKILAI